MNSIIIEPPKRSDIEIIYTWGQENRELWTSEELKWFSKKALTELITDPREHIFLVARVAGKLAGMCITYDLYHWAFVDDLFVVKEFRRGGIGQKLLEKTLAIFRKKGIDEIGLSVGVHNTSGQKFYKKLGFKLGFEKYVWMYK